MQQYGDRFVMNFDRKEDRQEVLIGGVISLPLALITKEVVLLIGGVRCNSGCHFGVPFVHAGLSS